MHINDLVRWPVFGRHLVALATVGAVLALVSPAGASTALRLDLEQMTRLSEIVVSGTVRSVEVLSPGEDDLRPVTEVALEVDEPLKGEPSGGPLRVRFIGGQHGEYTTRVIGAPRFSLDEEVVVFLESTSLGLTPVGLAQGKFTVIRPASGGEPLIRRELAGLRLLCPETGEELPCGRGQGPPCKTLTELQREIHTAVLRYGPRPEPPAAVLPRRGIRPDPIPTPKP